MHAGVEGRIPDPHTHSLLNCGQVAFSLLTILHATAANVVKQGRELILPLRPGIPHYHIVLSSNDGNAI